jgi:hypothetical protein
VQQQLDDLGFILVDLDRGGFGILPSSSLEGAPALTAKKYLPREVRSQYNDDRAFRRLRGELESDATEIEDDEAA